MNDNKINSKCPNCGSQLEYNTEANKLKCISCDSLFEIDSLGVGDLDEEELDFHEALNKLRENKLEHQVVTSFNCQNCGAVLSQNENTTSVVCPFCGSSHVIEQRLEEEIIPISGIVPFRFNKKQCNDKFHSWLKGKLFVPNKFKNTSFELDIYPIYLPFWTFDMECFTRYQAKRGDHRYVTVTKTDAQGNKRRERERVTDWSFRTGTCRNSFDDILVMGSKEQKSCYHIYKVCNFDFNSMEKFNTKYLVGYQSEKISLPLEEGFEKAKASVKFQIERTIEYDVGGDVVRILHYNTSYTDITFKQVMVPVYNGMYSYNGKKYSFVMNGQTGKFSGSSPVSVSKILALVFSIVGFIILAVILLMLII